MGMQVSSEHTLRKRHQTYDIIAVESGILAFVRSTDLGAV